MMTQKTYQQLQDELDEAMRKMQSSELDIDEALKFYKEAQAIIAQLEDRLASAQNEIEHLKKS